MRASTTAAALALLSLGFVRPAAAQGSAPSNAESGAVAPTTPNTEHLGVVPLPQGPAETIPQSSLPKPLIAFPKSDRPILDSPDLSAVKAFTKDHPLTIQDAVAIALYTSRELAADVAQLQQAEGRTGQARSSLNPTVGGEADITEFDAPTTANLSAFLPSSGPSSASTPPFVITNQFNPVLVATLSLPLDVSGSLRSAVSQAQFQEVAARIDVNRTRNQIVYNVKNAFFNVLRAQAQVAVATDALNNSLIRLDAANKNYAAGTAPRFDVISAQRDTADSQQNLVNAKAQRAASLSALKSAIGIDLTTRVTVSDQNSVMYPPGVEPPVLSPSGLASASPNGADVKSVPGEPVATPSPALAAPINTNENSDSPAPGLLKPQPIAVPGTQDVEDDFDFGPDFKRLLSEAIKTRGEVLEGEAQISAAKHGVQYARRSSLPSVSLSVSDTYSPNYAGFTRQNVGAVTLGVSIPIFDGGLGKSRLKEAYGAMASAEVTRREAVDQVTSDLQQAYINLVQSRSRIAVANVEIARAREAYRLALVRYNAGVSQQAGVSPQVELSDAQNTLTLAQSNQVNALYDYNSASAQLDRAVGRFSFTGTGPGYAAAGNLKDLSKSSESGKKRSQSDHK